MAVYNGAPYVSQAVESILNQTLGVFQFIIVDDASTDATPEILANFRDPRLLLLRNERNLGLAASLNRAIAQTSSIFVARQDADDRSEKERLARQIDFLEGNPHVGAVGTYTRWIDAWGNLQRTWEPPSLNPDIQSVILWYCPLIHGSSAFRRACWEEVGGYCEDLRAAQDYDFWLRVSERWDLANIPDYLYEYRWHEEMTSKKQQALQKDAATQVRYWALRRRLHAGVSALLYYRKCWPKHATRRWLAHRYCWWSASARMVDRRYALAFLLIALALDPFLDDTWRYVSGIARRKIARFSQR